MPKNKKKESSTDSDTSFEDRNPPEKKSKSTTSKAKEAPSKATKSNAKSKDGEAREWVLEGMRIVKVNEFRGRKTVDIREHFNSNGSILPTKKGISLTALQWRKLLEYADEITEEVSNQ